jgi:hypothetical protein
MEFFSDLETHPAARDAGRGGATASLIYGSGNTDPHAEDPRTVEASSLNQCDHDRSCEIHDLSSVVIEGKLSCFLSEDVVGDVGNHHSQCLVSEVDPDRSGRAWVKGERDAERARMLTGTLGGDLHN